MADLESKKNQAGGVEPNEHIRETHPNPHGEQEVAGMPVQTDHGTATRENVGQITNTVENRMNPSVNSDLIDPSGDSMFNSADPQTQELLKKEKAAKPTRGRKRPKAA